MFALSKILGSFVFENNMSHLLVGVYGCKFLDRCCGDKQKKLMNSSNSFSKDKYKKP